MIDLDRGVARSTAAAIEALLMWSEDRHEALGIGPFLAPIARMLSEGNGAQRQRALLASTGDPAAIVARSVARTEPRRRRPWKQ